MATGPVTAKLVTGKTGAIVVEIGAISKGTVRTVPRISGVVEVTQDPDPLVVEGAVIGVTAGAAAGATAVHDLQGGIAVTKGDQ
uniref:Uncharacterized protein n=1 Tax=Arundo donax TaxID=35708 RepID=A0A0A9G6I5_ARUDO